jgi:hypothetical protein
VQSNTIDVFFRYVLKIGIQGTELCVEKITTVVIFLSYCWEFESCGSGFHFGNSTLNNA